MAVFTIIAATTLFLASSHFGHVTSTCPKTAANGTLAGLKLQKRVVLNFINESHMLLPRQATFNPRNRKLLTDLLEFMTAREELEKLERSHVNSVVSVLMTAITRDACNYLKEHIYRDRTLPCTDRNVLRLLQNKAELVNHMVKTFDTLYYDKRERLGISASEVDEGAHWQAHVNCTTSPEHREIVDIFYTENLRDLPRSTTCNCQN